MACLREMHCDQWKQIQDSSSLETGRRFLQISKLDCFRLGLGDNTKIFIMMFSSKYCDIRYYHDNHMYLDKRSGTVALNKKFP